MSAKEILLKEIDELQPMEILRVRNYIYELKSIKRDVAAKSYANMEECRKALSKIKGSLSDSIMEEREDRI